MAAIKATLVAIRPASLHFLAATSSVGNQPTSVGYRTIVDSAAVDSRTIAAQADPVAGTQFDEPGDLAAVNMRPARRAKIMSKR